LLLIVFPLVLCLGLSSFPCACLSSQGDADTNTFYPSAFLEDERSCGKASLQIKSAIYQAQASSSAAGAFIPGVQRHQLQLLFCEKLSNAISCVLLPSNQCLPSWQHLTFNR